MRPSGLPRRRGLFRAAERLVGVWALAGGAAILAVVAVNLLEIASALLRPLTGWRFTGAVELTEMGVAVAAFAFLPWCQMMGANVTADIFTARARPWAVAVLTLAATLVAFGFAGLMLWRMGAGFADQRDFATATAILGVPLWWAWVPVMVSLGLWVLAGAVTVVEAAGALARTLAGRMA